MPAKTPVPVWPRIEAITRADGSGELTINGTSEPVQTRDVDDAREVIIRRIAATAAKLGRPVRVATTGPEGDWPLIVHPDGTVEEDPDGTPRPRAVEAPLVEAAPAQPTPAPAPEPPVARTTPAQPATVQPDRPAMTAVEKLLARLDAERAERGVRRPGTLR